MVQMKVEIFQDSAPRLVIEPWPDQDKRKHGNEPHEEKTENHIPHPAEGQKPNHQTNWQEGCIQLYGLRQSPGKSQHKSPPPFLSINRPPEKESDEKDCNSHRYIQRSQMGMKEETRHGHQSSRRKQAGWFSIHIRYHKIQNPDQEPH